MYQNIGLVAAKAAEKEIAKLEVVIMGMGTVLVGLICIVVLCKIVGLFCGSAKKSEKIKKVSAEPKAVEEAPIENKGEIVAAVCACVAEELGTDISALRVHSFKKL